MKYMQSQNAADYHFIRYNSVINNSVEAFDISFFKNVSSEVNERSSLGYQATNEIVQHLVQKGFIERDTPEYIKLTQKGLDKCKEEDCH